MSILQCLTPFLNDLIRGSIEIECSVCKTARLRIPMNDDPVSAIPDLANMSDWFDRTCPACQAKEEGDAP